SAPTRCGAERLATKEWRENGERGLFPPRADQIINIRAGLGEPADGACGGAEIGGAFATISHKRFDASPGHHLLSVRASGSSVHNSRAAATLPLVARAQQRSMPVIGWIYNGD